MNNGIYDALLLSLYVYFSGKNELKTLVGYSIFYLIVTVSVKSLKPRNNVIMQGDLKFFLQWRKKYSDKQND